jgi:hypothetical protein
MQGLSINLLHYAPKYLASIIKNYYNYLLIYLILCDKQQTLNIPNRNHQIKVIPPLKLKNNQTN